MAAADHEQLFNLIESYLEGQAWVVAWYPANEEDGRLTMMSNCKEAGGLEKLLDMSKETVEGQEPRYVNFRRN